MFIGTRCIRLCHYYWFLIFHRWQHDKGLFVTTFDWVLRKFFFFFFLLCLRVTPVAKPECREKEGKEGKKSAKAEGSFTLPLLTKSPGYVTQWYRHRWYRGGKVLQIRTVKHIVGTVGRACHTLHFRPATWYVLNVHTTCLVIR